MKERDGLDNKPHFKGRLTSDALATLIVDALIDAKIVSSENFERSLAIAIEEIDARKAAGDY